MRLKPLSQRNILKFLPVIIVLAVAAWALAAGAAGVHAADDDVDIDSPPAATLEEDEPPVYLWISEESVARHNLEMLFRRRIAFVDRVCTLTDAQKQKLELVSRGDVKRLLDRIHDIELAVQRGEIAPAEVPKLVQESQQIKSGISIVGSLSANLLGQLLTREQLAKYEPLRMVIHIGGRIQTEDTESGAVLEIDIHDTAFGDHDAVHLGDFPRLQRLFLANTRVTNDALANVRGLTNLEWLDVAGAQVTSDGLQNLRGLTNLQWLSLARTRVSDSGLAHLSRLARLQALDLEGTPVTNAGLLHLAQLTRLERLNVSNTQVTDAGVASLQRALPKLAIRHGNPAQGGMGGGFF